jgi:CHAD domain-containing protein
MDAVYNEVMNPTNLDPETKEHLQSITKSTQEQLARRARLILAYAGGMQTCQAAQTAGLSDGRARYWKREFSNKGMAIFQSPHADPALEILGEQKPEEGDSPQIVQFDAEIFPIDAEADVTETKKRKKQSKKRKQVEYPELAYPEPVKSTGILPGDTLAEAGKKVFLAQFAEMIRHEEGTRLGDDIESLHDMRVATRRMRAAFSVFGDAYNNKTIKPYLIGLRQTGRLLGNVRDLDVFMEKANSYLNMQPVENRNGLDPLLMAWQSQRNEARGRLVDHFNSASYEEFKLSFNYFIQTHGYGERVIPDYEPTPSRVYEIAPYLIYACLARVRTYEIITQTASIQQLHALRIEFKRLRYILEYFSEVLGGEARQVIELVKILQDHLGDLHDADVACQILNNFLENWDQAQAGLHLSDLKNPEPIVNYLGYQYAERHRLLVTFPEAWASFVDTQIMRKIALAISVL